MSDDRILEIAKRSRADNDFGGLTEKDFEEEAQRRAEAIRKPNESSQAAYLRYVGTEEGAALMDAGIRASRGLPPVKKAAEPEMEKLDDEEAEALLERRGG